MRNPIALRLIIPTLATLMLAGCSSGPKNPESAAQPKAAPAPQLETGRISFQRMYAAARLWAADAQPAHLESELTKADDGTDGKAGVWRGTFASSSRRAVKTFIWSGVDEDANARGVTPGTEDTYNPGNASLQAFDFAYLKVDSDAALATAKGKLKGKNAATPVKYTLSFDGRKSQLIWAVEFGASDAATTVDIDATTGAYLRTER